MLGGEWSALSTTFRKRSRGDRLEYEAKEDLVLSPATRGYSYRDGAAKQAIHADLLSDPAIPRAREGTSPGLRGMAAKPAAFA